MLILIIPHTDGTGWQSAKVYHVVDAKLFFEGTSLPSTDPEREGGQEAMKVYKK